MVVTVDAMHTQTDTATVITEAGGDYVFTVKGNTHPARGTIKNLPWEDVPAHRVTVTGHGRRVTRTIKVIERARPGSASPAPPRSPRLRRTVTRKPARRPSKSST